MLKHFSWKLSTFLVSVCMVFCRDVISSQTGRRLMLSDMVPSDPNMLWMLASGGRVSSEVSSSCFVWLDEFPQGVVEVGLRLSGPVRARLLQRCLVIPVQPLLFTTSVSSQWPRDDTETKQLIACDPSGIWLNIQYGLGDFFFGDTFFIHLFIDTFTVRFIKAYH